MQSPIQACRAGSPRELLAANGAADVQKRLQLPADVFGKAGGTGLAAGVGTEEPGSLHFVSLLVSLANLVHNTKPLQAAVQLPVKEILASRGCDETYSPIKVPV